MTDDRFDQLLKEMREEGITAEEVATARDRVWRRIAGATSLACSEFRPEFADYRAGRLTESRRLLIDDHLGRCAECRRALDGTAGEGPLVAMPAALRVQRPGWRWAVAAGIAAAAL